MIINKNSYSYAMFGLVLALAWKCTLCCAAGMPGSHGSHRQTLQRDSGATAGPRAELWGDQSFPLSWLLRVGVEVFGQKKKTHGSSAVTCKAQIGTVRSHPPSTASLSLIQQRPNSPFVAVSWVQLSLVHAECRGWQAQAVAGGSPSSPTPLVLQAPGASSAVCSQRLSDGAHLPACCQVPSFWRSALQLPGGSSLCPFTASHLGTCSSP